MARKIKRQRGGASFLCPRCKAPTSVTKTKRDDDGLVRRRRVCPQGHETMTEERKHK